MALKKEAQYPRSTNRLHLYSSTIGTECQPSTHSSGFQRPPHHYLNLTLSSSSSSQFLSNSKLRLEVLRFQSEEANL